MAPLNVLLDFLDLAERPMHTLLDAVNDELGRMGVTDLNDRRAVMILQLGDGEISPTLLGGCCGTGPNATYNVKKLAAAGYIDHYRAAADRRRSLVRLTPKGVALRDRLLAGVGNLPAILDDLGAEIVVAERVLRSISARLGTQREHRLRLRNR